MGGGSGLFSEMFHTFFKKATADVNHTSMPERSDWVKHLLCFEDVRFAQHHQFRYQVQNDAAPQEKE